MIVQDYEFLQITYFGIRTTLGCSFIPKYIIVYMSSLYENASKTTQHSCYVLRMIVQV